MRKTLALLVIVSVAFVLRIRRGGALWLDEAILRAFHAIVATPLTWAAIVTTWLGSVLVLGPLSIVLARRRVAASRREAWALVLAGLGASFVHLVLKITVPRPRPTLFPAIMQAPGEGSFPSGHAVNVTAFFVTLALIDRRAALPAAAIIAWVSATRLYLQVHWPSDVISGIVIGAAYALLLRVITGAVARE